MVSETRRFTWKIENFDVIRQSKGLIDAQMLKFSAGSTIGLKTEWKCYLQFSEEKEGEENDWIGIFAKLTKMSEKNKEEINARYKLKIWKNDYDDLFCEEECTFKINA